MEKVHSRINWENYPSIATPLNEANLNKMDKALDEVDNRVLGLDTAKLDKSTANTMVKDVTFDESTGIFTVTLLNGTAKTINTKLEKVVTNFRYDNQSQKLVLTLADGSEQQVDLSSLISNYEFADGNIITFIIGSDGKVTANVKDGSITESKLQPNFLANVKTEVSKAKSYADSSYENATTSKNAVNEAKQYRDEALQFRNEALTGTPEGYAELVENVAENTFKIDTVIAKADLGIKETATGEELHLTDSADGKAVEFALYGKAKQNTTTGKNLTESVEKLIWNANSSGTKLEKDSVNKKIIITTNGTSNYSGCWTTPKQELIGKTCTVSADVTISNGEKVAFGFGPTARNIVANTKTRLSSTAVITESSSIVIYSGELVIKTITVENLQIEYGEVATPFEEFTNGATPRPDYPQPIEVSGASGSVEVKSVGKNLVENFTNDGFTNQYGVILYVKADLKPSTRYTLSFKDVIGNIYYVNESLIKDFTTVTTSEITSVTFTTKDILDTRQYSSNKGWYLLKNYINQPTAPDFSEVMLCEEYITDNTYEPYKETLSTIPTENGLAGIKVSANGTYTDKNGQQWICDEIVKYADGSGEKIQRVGSDIITNTTSFMSGTTGGLNASDINTSQPLNSMGKETAVMCNYYSVPKNTTGWSSTEPCIISRTNNSSLRIHWQKDITTKDQANEFLANNEVIVKYILAEPITTPLTAEEIAEIEKLHTFYPVTNISNDFDCGMSAKYYCDSKNYIDKKISELATAMVNNI